MRDISTYLRDHLNEPVTTTCRLLRLILRNGGVYGMTTLDRNVEYPIGSGVIYYAINGFDPSVIATDTGVSVDNSEVRALLSADIPGITVEMVRAGELDDATWEMLLVNWNDLSQGHMILDSGDVGEVREVDGMVYMPELVSILMRLRQAIGHVWSRMCRATFGTPADSQTGCGVNAEVFWVSGTVTGLGESRRVFADSGLSLAVTPVPGRLQWLTGNNTSSRVYQVEAFDAATGGIALLEPVPFDIMAGDTFRIRQDCDKQPYTCKTVYDNWLNYKGESLIPVGDGAAVLTPGAQVSGGFAGSTIA